MWALRLEQRKRSIHNRPEVIALDQTVGNKPTVTHIRHRQPDSLHNVAESLELSLWTR
jgi:hypothetical protein